MDKVPTHRIFPTWNFERELYSKGFQAITGVDEAGRGAWAGPLVAGAVILPHPDTIDSTSELAVGLAELRDSKMLSAETRERLYVVVQEAAVAVGVGIVSSCLIDVIGIGFANKLAWVRALRSMPLRADYLLLDAFKLPSVKLPQKPIIRGDAACISIAAASIIAKVTRDHIMHEMDEGHPGWGFSQHKGYGTRYHSTCIERLGVAPVHRKSFAPIRAALMGQSALTEIEEQDVEEQLVVA